MAQRSKNSEFFKGRVIGFVALGALVVLIAVALLSERSASISSTVPTEAETAAAPTDGTQDSVVAPPAAVPDTSLTESIPTVSRQGVITAVASDVALSPQASLLAERFQCVCGCKDILASCSCTETPGSRDMKMYLQSLVDQELSPIAVQDAMVARYGPEVLP